MTYLAFAKNPLLVDFNNIRYTITYDMNTNQLIRQLADKENEQREEVTKKYVTQDEKESEEYERGFRDGWHAAKDKFWAEGFGAGLMQAKEEEESD